MSIEVKLPQLGESVSSATIAKWLVKVGDIVADGQGLCTIETEKVTMDVPAPSAGVIEQLLAGEGTDVTPNAIIAMMNPTAKGSAQTAGNSQPAPVVPTPAPATANNNEVKATPSAGKMLREGGIDPQSVNATGPKGHITKGDVLNHQAQPIPQPAEQAATTAFAQPGQVAPKPSMPAETGPRPADPRGEERIRMTKLRQVIATRLKMAQNTAAMLTTFNEVDMSALIKIRNDYKDSFEKRHGAKLGFMSFFVRAVCYALKEFPAVNAEIYGQEIIFKNFYDIGIAVGSPQGLVVPVLRDADKLSFAAIEVAIADFGKRARDGKLTVSEMTGGTFTITNGGIFGSLLSTPIINPPQSGILGMHKIAERPIAKNGQVVIAPMMYLAHSYDHRIIDGREAVQFLVRIKEYLESPERILLDV